jgi:hypothetical protein
MQAPKRWVRVIGSAVMFFAVIHLFLNLYIVIAHFTLEPDRLRGFVTALSKALGNIVVPDGMGAPVFFVKVLVSLSFLVAGAGLAALKGWSRRPLVALLALRLFYGVFICVHYKAMHPHLGLLFFEFIFLAYYLTRPAVRAVFGK